MAKAKLKQIRLNFKSYMHSPLSIAENKIVLHPPSKDGEVKNEVKLDLL